MDTQDFCAWQACAERFLQDADPYAIKFPSATTLAEWWAFVRGVKHALNGQPPATPYAPQALTHRLNEAFNRVIYAAHTQGEESPSFEQLDAFMHVQKQLCEQTCVAHQQTSSFIPKAAATAWNNATDRWIVRGIDENNAALVELGCKHRSFQGCGLKYAMLAVHKNNMAMFDLVAPYIDVRWNKSELLVEAARAGRVEFVEKLLPLSNPTKANSRALREALQRLHTKGLGPALGFVGGAEKEAERQEKIKQLRTNLQIVVDVLLPHSNISAAFFNLPPKVAEVLAPYLSKNALKKLKAPQYNEWRQLPKVQKRILEGEVGSVSTQGVRVRKL